MTINSNKAKVERKPEPSCFDFLLFLYQAIVMCNSAWKMYYLMICRRVRMSLPRSPYQMLPAAKYEEKFFVLESPPLPIFPPSFALRKGEREAGLSPWQWFSLSFSQDSGKQDRVTIVTRPAQQVLPGNVGWGIFSSPSPEVSPVLNKREE